MPSEARQKKIMEKLNRAQKCSILGPQNLGSGGGPGPPGPPPGSAPGSFNIIVMKRYDRFAFLKTTATGSVETRMFLKQFQ